MDKEGIISRKIALQIFAETYLLRVENKTLKETIENFEYGIVTEEQEAYMRGYLSQEYDAIGLDLIEEVEKSGEKFPETELSNYEVNELKRRADKLVKLYSLVNEAFNN